MTVTPQSLYGAVVSLNRASGFHGEKPLNALGTVVQCWHETGGYTSRVMGAFHNLAGISCTPSWVKRGGKCFSGKTWEHLKGQDQTLVKGFRAYPSLSAFLEDYSRLISEYYPVSAGNSDCVYGYLWGLQHGRGGRRWATDPHYIEKLFALVKQLAPALLDKTWHMKLARSAEAALRRGVPREKLPVACWADHL